MWEKLPGQAHEIAAGANGSVWCLGMAESPNGNSIHRWNTQAWDQIEGAAAKIAAATDGHVWTIDRHNRIFTNSDSGCTERPGLAREISVGNNGDVWCISAADVAPGGGSIHFWNGSDWDHVEGAAVKIAADTNGQTWIVNSAGQIFRRSGEGWELLPGLASEIAIGAEADVCCLSQGLLSDGGHSIHRWNGTDWDHIPGSATRIAVGPAGTVYVVNAQHDIFRWIPG